MIKFMRIEIRNFVCFDKIIIEPSTDPNKPLTVVRAENGSGKTTLLRAIRWGMYGEKGLPSSYPLHPAWWTPDNRGKTTMVSIEFETDGSDRSNDTSGSENMSFQLMRAVTTIGKYKDNKNDLNFVRVKEQTQLMRRGMDGIWSPFPAGADLVVEQLLPWGLRDFFVMDADEVVDFVGGALDDNVLPEKQIIAKTTAAVNELLGLDVFRMAKDRVEKAGMEFGKQAAAAGGKAVLIRLQQELDRCQNEIKNLQKEILDNEEVIDDLEKNLTDRNISLGMKLKGIEIGEELSNRQDKNIEAKKNLLARRTGIVNQLSGQTESTELLATLSRTYISSTHDLLKPLHDSGHIPAKHLHYVRSLLERGVCVCGQDISSNNEHRKQVLNSLSKSSEQEERANFLAQIFDATRSLIEFIPADMWSEQCHNLEGDLVRVNGQIADLQTDMEYIQEQLNSIDNDEIQLLRREIESLEGQVNRVRSQLARNQVLLSEQVEEESSLKKKWAQMVRTEIVARDKLEAKAIAEVIKKVLEKSYRIIQVEQVIHLSDKMNDLFSQMAFNVTDEDVKNNSNKADIKMIDKVGIQPTDSNQNKYEIVCYNSHGFNMPPSTINGASRRVLALSFVLALCVESRTFAPLVADSLLHMLAGAVRRNTLLITAKTSNQPILLLTSSDLESQSEINIIDKFAGAVYTITGQWDAIEVGPGGDVLNLNDQRSVALICRCGPRSYCNICERVGWADSPDWNKRESER